MGFVTLQQTSIFANYALGQLHVDLLFTQGAHTQGMLTSARPYVFRDLTTKVVDPIGIIALKLQALENNQDRPSDATDILSLLKLHRHAMDKDLLREYYRLFGKEHELDRFLETLA